MTDLPKLDWNAQRDEELGHRIQAAREGQGLSLQMLADHLGISKATAGHWETGARSIKHHDLAALCAALRVSSDQLLFDRSIWPFAGIDANKILMLEPEEIQQLQGGLLAVASQIGVDVVSAKPHRESRAKSKGAQSKRSA